jgi:hypothetical protein
MHHTKPRSSLRDLKPLRIQPGIEMPGYCHHVAPRRPNAKCLNRPSQNENRKSVPVRRHPLSCDFSATSQISVIAQPRACAPRPVPRRHSRPIPRSVENSPAF